MLYGSTGKPSRPLSSEEKAAKEKAERKRHCIKIILYIIGGVLLLPILIPVGIVMLLYLLVCKTIEKVKDFKDNGRKLHAKHVDEEFDSKPKLISHTITECDKELPVHFNKFYVVYVESEYNEPLNRFISENLEYIRKKFSERNYRFVYIPELKNLTDEELSLAFPLDAATMADEVKDKIRNLSTAEFTHMFARMIGMDVSSRMAGLLSLGSYEGDYGIRGDIVDYSKSDFVYVDLQRVDADRIKDAFEEYFRYYSGEKHVPFSVRPRDEYPLDEWQDTEKNGRQNDSSDWIFLSEQEEMTRIADDIKHKVEILKQGGYIELLLHTLGADIVKQINDSRKTANNLMHITVDNDLTIRIPELSNREVKMPALSRALYVFYLRHTEGVEFKFLSEYTEEIFALYRLTSNRIDDSKLRATVDSLVNPTENKINECVSRIKSAFLSIMDEYLARNYFLQYRMKEIRKEDSVDQDVVRIYKDMAKYVSLPREYVSYPSSLNNVTFVKGQSFDERALQEEEFNRRLDRMENVTGKISELELKKTALRKGNKLQQLKAEQIEASKAVLELEPMNFLAHFNLGEAYCNAIDYAKAISENTMLIEHDAYTWNAAYINRAEAYLYASEYDKGLADIDSYFNSLRRWKEGDKEAERIKKNLLRMKSKS